MPPTSILMSNAGWQHAPATTCTSRPPTLPGSTKWKSGSISSPRRPSVGAPLAGVKELVAKIESFVHRYNAEARPFSWTATPDSILEKIQRLCERISGTQHWQIIYKKRSYLEQ